MGKGANKETPIVRLGKLSVGQKQEIRLGSPDWYVWLGTAQRFYFEGEATSFTARREQRQRGGDYWFGYRSVDGKTHNIYLGRAAHLNSKSLEEAATKLH